MNALIQQSRDAKFFSIFVSTTAGPVNLPFVTYGRPRLIFSTVLSWRRIQKLHWDIRQSLSTLPVNARGLPAHHTDHQCHQPSREWPRVIKHGALTTTLATPRKNVKYCPTYSQRRTAGHMVWCTLPFTLALPLSFSHSLVRFLFYFFLFFF